MTIILTACTTATRIAFFNASITASFDAIIDVVITSGFPMRTTVNLDDKLLAKAKELSGMTERNDLLHEALNALIQRESAKRLARLGGSEPALLDIPRRRENAE